MIKCARIKNAGLQITGFLHREHDIYYQWLEGPAEHVGPLADVIAMDPRHADFDILHRAANQPRRFADWAMGYSDAQQTSLFDWASQMDVSLRRINPAQILNFLTGQAALQRAG